MAQTATTGSLENAQRTIISSARYTAEHNAPALALIEHFTLGKGNSTVTVPKVGQMTISDLTDGQDIVDEEDIGMSTVDLTASEVGAKVILTDKLVRQTATNVFSMIGRQLGDGMARKKDNDVTALYTSTNNGTNLGATTKLMSAVNLASAIAYAKGNKFGSQLYAVHHPFAVFSFVKSAAVTPSATYPVPDGWAQDLLKEFFVGLRPLNGVPLFEDGNITVDSSNDAIGFIGSKDCLGVLESVKEKTERQRDASMRATEVVITSDYGVFELDDTRGAGMKYAAGTPSTSA
jgi:hypothetical protein